MSTLFDPPWSCTEEEYVRLVGRAEPALLAMSRALDLELVGDAAWLRIHDLCRLRGDAIGAAHALEQIDSQLMRDEMTYRDVIQTHD
jgi:hypothetical protein